MTSRTESVGWKLRKIRELSFSVRGWLLTFGARRGLAAGAARGGGRCKFIIERFFLSLPYVEKPLNSKVIKSFVPELRSRQVFFVFRDSYVIYIWVMNILCTFHIFMYGYVTYTYTYNAKDGYNFTHSRTLKLKNQYFSVISTNPLSRGSHFYQQGCSPYFLKSTIRAYH